MKKLTYIWLLIVISLISQKSFAWSTRDFGNDGPHPELLSQSTCLYDANNYYQSGPYSESHSYTGKIRGFNIIGTGSGGANTGLGIAGTGFYESGNLRYFVGRYAEYVVIRERGGRDAQSMPYYKYQICYYNPVSFSYYGYENSTSSCPATQPSGAVYIQRRYEVWTDGSVRNYTGWYETSRNCQAVMSYYGYNNSTSACPATQPNGVIYTQQRYEVWTDGSVRNYTGWYETSRTCQAVFSYYGEEYSTSACPATQPSGYIAIARLYEVWSDGSKRNYQAWRQTANYCQAVKQGNESQTQILACSTYGGAYTEGGNGITQNRSREIWSDGARAWSAWSTTSNTCYKTVGDTQAQKTYACAEGQTGKIVKEPRRTHIEYAADASKTDAEKAALNEKNATVWIEYVISNTCTDVASRTWTEAGTRNVSCESVLGSGYVGTATQKGTYTYNYSSTTKQTTSTFTPSSTDTSSCSNTLSDLAMETTTESCPTGQSGSITKYRYVATDSSGNKTYPQGTTYQILSNTCVGNATSSDTATTDATTLSSSGLLSNNTLKSSDTTNLNSFVNFTKSLSSSTLNEASYKLNIVIDDMSTTKYNVSSVSTAVNTFKSKMNDAGKNSEVTVSFPTDLSKYGVLKDTTNKSFEKAVLNDNGTATISYKNLGTSLNSSSNSTFNVNVLQNVNGISDITVN